MDTLSSILAVASPPGRSGRGIIRISGAHAFELLRHRLHVSAAASSSRERSSIADDLSRGAFRATFSMTESRCFGVVALAFPAPFSYTGEHSIELQLPGNPLLLERVIDSILDSARNRDIAARRAEPGEFTARAYFNGKLSLIEAEGVAATIAAQSDAQLRAARLLTSGSLGNFALVLADDLAASLALVEAGIDFTDQEDVVAIGPGTLFDRLTALCARMDAYLKRAVGTEHLEAIPWVVLVGEPNAGKSALFNALLGRERAVVSPTAGTTRDVIAEPLMISTDHGTAEVMLCDLAGLDAAGSEIDCMMQNAARGAIERAELILHCAPVSVHSPPKELRWTTDSVGQSPAAAIPVRTKADLSPSPQTGVIAVSAFTGQGLNDLRSAIAKRLSERAVSLAADAVALRPRHEAALRSAVANLQESIALVEPTKDARSLADPELVAASMRAALDELGALAGDITPDEILGRVFATFCVGK